MTEYFKAYVTKYALTDGIVIVDAEASENSIGMISYKKPDHWGTMFAHGKDWHRTEEQALARAEEMRKKKIVSLEKSIAKMRSIEIKVRDL